MGSAIRVIPLTSNPGGPSVQKRAVETWCNQLTAHMRMETAKSQKCPLSPVVQLEILNSFVAAGSGPAEAFDAARAPAPRGQGWNDAAKRQEDELDALRAASRAEVRFTDPPEGETGPQRRTRHEAETAAHDRACEALREDWYIRSTRPAAIVGTVTDFFRASYDTASLKADGARALADWRLDPHNVHDSVMRLLAAASRAGGFTRPSVLADQLVHGLESYPETASMAAQATANLAARFGPQGWESLTPEIVLAEYEQLDSFHAGRQACQVGVRSAPMPARIEAMRDARTPRSIRALAAPMHANGPSSMQRPRCPRCHTVGHEASDCHTRDESAWRSSPYYNPALTCDQEAQRRRERNLTRGAAPRAPQGDGRVGYNAMYAPARPPAYGGRGGRHSGPAAGGRGFGPPRREPAVAVAATAEAQRSAAAEIAELRERVALLAAAHGLPPDQPTGSAPKHGATSLAVLAAPNAVLSHPATRSGQRVNGVLKPRSFTAALPAPAPAAGAKRQHVGEHPFGSAAAPAAPAHAARQPDAEAPANLQPLSHKDLQARPLAQPSTDPVMKLSLPQGCEITIHLPPGTANPLISGASPAGATSVALAQSELRKLLGRRATAYGTGPATFLMVECTIRAHGRTVRIPPGRVLLDSGSQLCVASQDLADALGLHPGEFHDPNVQVNGITGSEQPSQALYAEFCVAPGTPEAATTPTEFVVMPTKHFSIVLGRRFLAANKVVLDFGSDTVTISTDAGHRAALPFLGDLPVESLSNPLSAGPRVTQAAMAPVMSLLETMSTQLAAQNASIAVLTEAKAQIAPLQLDAPPPVAAPPAPAAPPALVQTKGPKPLHEQLLQRCYLELGAAACGSLVADQPSYTIFGAPTGGTATLQSILSSIVPSLLASVSDALLPGARLVASAPPPPGSPLPPTPRTAGHEIVRDSSGDPRQIHPWELATARGLTVIPFVAAAFHAAGFNDAIAPVLDNIHNVHALSTVLTAMQSLGFLGNAPLISQALGGGAAVPTPQASSRDPSPGGAEDKAKAPSSSSSGKRSKGATWEINPAARRAMRGTTASQLMWLLLATVLLIPALLLTSNCVASSRGTAAAVPRPGLSSVMASASAATAALPTPTLPAPTAMPVEAHSRPPSRMVPAKPPSRPLGSAAATTDPPAHSEPLPPRLPPPAFALALGAAPAAASAPASGLSVSYAPHDQSTPPPPVLTALLVLAAALADDSTVDIWADEPSLQFLRRGTYPANASSDERNRIGHRASRYRWEPDSAKLLRVLADGSTREVPPLADRSALVQQAHSKYGHWGIRRTFALLSPFYWWHAMWNDTADTIRQCPVCDRSKASYNIRPAELTPLPIRGPGYRWHVDLAGPLPPTPTGHTYVMICVEAFTKWVEAVPIPDKNSSTVADAFLFHVLSRVGACAEVVTDQGKEFQGDFEDLLVQNGMDHRTTSHDHPQADGLAERVVQSVKNCLRRCCDEDTHTWASVLPWILMGYRMTPQAATHLSPYSLMFGTFPVIPPAIVERISVPIDYDSPTSAVRMLIEKSNLLRQLMPQALDNLLIAQHQDSRRYAQVRSGGYRPEIARLFEGDFVYLRPPGQQATLELGATPDVLRVVELRTNGVAVLQGQCGLTVPENVTSISLCRLPNLNGTIDPSLAPRSDNEIPCERCNLITAGHPNHMLLCDICNTGWHMRCLQPPLSKLPPKAAPFYCPYCVRLGRNLGRSLLSASLAVVQTAYASRTDLERTLAALMPGPWSKSHVTRLFNLLPGQSRFAQAVHGVPQRVPTLLAEYDPLLRYIDWASVSSACDPWSGNGTTAEALRMCTATSTIDVTLSDIDPQANAHSCGNALDLSYLRYLSSTVAGHAFDVAVCSPLFALLDLAIPTIFSLVSAAAFIHVPGHYLSNMPPARRAWFERHSDLCCVLTSLPVGPMGRRCAWVCLFKSAGERQRLLRPPVSAKSISFFL
jgi:hypothetical protein